MIPYRIEIAGGWLDQPWVSSYYPGAIITTSIEPTYNFPDRTGMATSTRKRAIDLWGEDIPPGDSEKLAKILFCYDNFPGYAFISGSQDSLGIVLPGLNKLNYDGKYWPDTINSVYTPKVISWMEQNFKLIPVTPKDENYNVLRNINLQRNIIRELAKEVEACWNAIMEMNTTKLGRHISKSFQKQVELFPEMMSKSVKSKMDEYKKKVCGMKVVGSGSFICAVAPEPIKDEIKIKIRNKI